MIVVYSLLRNDKLDGYKVFNIYIKVYRDLMQNKSQTQ